MTAERRFKNLTVSQAFLAGRLDEATARQSDDLYAEIDALLREDMIAAAEAAELQWRIDATIPTESVRRFRLRIALVATLAIAAGAATAVAALSFAPALVAAAVGAAASGVVIGQQRGRGAPDQTSARFR